MKARIKSFILWMVGFALTILRDIRNFCNGDYISHYNVSEDYRPLWQLVCWGIVAVFIIYLLIPVFDAWMWVVSAVNNLRWY